MEQVIQESKIEALQTEIGELKQEIDRLKVACFKIESERNGIISLVEHIVRIYAGK